MGTKCAHAHWSLRAVPYVPQNDAEKNRIFPGGGRPSREVVLTEAQQQQQQQQHQQHQQHQQPQQQRQQQHWFLSQQ